ncbi:MAG: ATP-binding protein [Candidatus Binatia bacterium]
MAQTDVPSTRGCFAAPMHGMSAYQTESRCAHPKNALEALESVNDRRREIAVAVDAPRADEVRVTVTDSGPGLERGQRERLFEAFHTTKPGGMGMGLAISRSIIEAHGGRLWASDNAGPGATFGFELPVASAAVAQTQGTTDTSTAARAAVSERAELTRPLSVRDALLRGIDTAGLPVRG